MAFFFYGQGPVNPIPVYVFTVGTGNNKPSKRGSDIDSRVSKIKHSRVPTKYMGQSIQEWTK